MNEVCYQTQNRAYKLAFDKVGVISTSTTHTNRGTALRYIDAQNVPESQLRRAGRWNTDTMEGSYLTSLPLQPMRSLAGFYPDRPGTYYIKRATIDPPQGLQRQIFPEVEKWQEAFRTRYLGKKKLEPDVAGPKFLELLVKLRTVLLQVLLFIFFKKKKSTNMVLIFL